MSSSTAVASGSSTSRPVTSKPRGICKYYTTERGCFAGRTCKFLHGPVATHTPYDQAKTCRFYAAGFCKRGAQCWFSHAKGKEKEVIEEEDDLCSICFEKPITYGLLNGCDHIFCITCIKQWRDPVNKTEAGAGNTKLCPMCRQPAKFIIPSSKYYAHGEDKDAVMARYMDSMSRVPCRYFQKSLEGSSRPFCPFGKDCFYQHRNLDGTEHIIRQGVDTCMRIYAARRESAPLFPHRSDLIRSLEHVFAETARLGLNPPMRGFPDGNEDETTVMRRLELLADQMLASLTGQRLPSDSDGESDEEDTEMPSLERIIVSNNNRAADWPLPMMFDSDSDEMPALASVSNSSDSDPSSDSADSDSSSEDSDEAATDEQAPPIRPFDLEFDPGMQARHEDGGVFERFSNLWAAPAPAVREAEAALIESTTRGVEAASDSTTPVEEEDADDADDDEDMPPLEREPPFVTDGRGRVVWSSPSGSGYVTPSSSARRASASGIPGAFSSGTRAVPPEKPPSPRQPPGEGGFTTDGRGRVIGTTGTREDEEAEREETDDEEPEAPTPARSFLGRVLGAFF